MISLRSSALLALALLGCTRDNPAFEGGDELLDGSSDKASEGASVGSEGASGSVGTETTNTSDPTSESTTDPSTTDATSTSESTTDPSTSESTTDPSTSESTSEPLDTVDGLDAPIDACPQPFFVDDCYSCITVQCCDENSNSWCFVPDNACFPMLQCLAEGTHPDICQNMWTPTVEEYDTALELFSCGKDAQACFEWCA